MKRKRIIALIAVVVFCISAMQVFVSAYDIRNVRAPVSASKIVYG